MARSTLSTSAEKDCVDKVKAFILDNRAAMEADSQKRDEAENRKIDAEDLARSMVRAAELVWLTHLKDDMKNVVEQITATGSAAKTLGNIAADNLATALLASGVGPATAVPAAVASTVAAMPADIAALAKISATPLNIQTPNGAPILIL